MLVQICKYRKEKRGQKGSDIDWFSYREKILDPKFYDYYEKTHARHSGKTFGLWKATLVATQKLQILWKNVN